MVLISRLSKNIHHLFFNFLGQTKSPERVPRTFTAAAFRGVPKTPPGGSEVIARQWDQLYNIEWGYFPFRFCIYHCNYRGQAQSFGDQDTAWQSETDSTETTVPLLIIDDLKGPSQCFPLSIVSVLCTVNLILRGLYISITKWLTGSKYYPKNTI